MAGLVPTGLTGLPSWLPGCIPTQSCGQALPSRRKVSAKYKQRTTPESESSADRGSIRLCTGVISTSVGPACSASWALASCTWGRRHQFCEQPGFQGSTSSLRQLGSSPAGQPLLGSLRESRGPSGFWELVLSYEAGQDSQGTSQRRGRFNSLLCHRLPVETRAGHLAAPGLSFPLPRRRASKKSMSRDSAWFIH